MNIGSNGAFVFESEEKNYYSFTNLHLLQRYTYDIEYHCLYYAHVFPHAYISRE